MHIYRQNGKWRGHCDNLDLWRTTRRHLRLVVIALLVFLFALWARGHFTTTIELAPAILDATKGGHHME